jgi:hypothetical protein
VAEVELIPASLYAGEAPTAPLPWAFREDRARYREEQMAGSVLAPLVKRTLEMEFAADPAGRRAMDELSETAAAQGVVAVVTMASGEVIVAGYSLRFGTEFPMRVTGREADSGLSPGDFPTLSLTLESIY